ncbi:mechanosensitive ion channel family protein [Solimonas marina]|uniref:Mechanosensitive ion channel n=1 Tax=Solimonas marina TaxID=2714601 RepID=A0A970BAM2_9GAMM|nr:mechanosensitive ion channel domain-containing protein [Solimonas marina]NKF24594.1 mechanosensitive ion channel [Solimonas marina]
MHELWARLRVDLPDWVWTALAICAALLLVILGMRLLRMALLRATRPESVTGLIVRRTHTPLTVVVLLAVLNIVWQAAPDTTDIAGVGRRIAIVIWIGSLTWLLLRCVAVGGEAVIHVNPYASGSDDVRGRARLTQARVLTRLLYLLVLVLGVALALLTFPSVRQVGASLLASAGIAGLAFGLAAKPVLGNLLAGMQLAITQPIRLDDVLIVEGEWGRVEEITGTYVVIAIWDQRRLIVPLQYFIEKPFQNWTRSSSQILGTVMLWVDYRLPVEPIREETQRLCALDGDWDGRLAIVQVTDTTPAAMQLRVLLSSADSGRNFDLRCRVREGLIAYIAREYPLYLPHTRAELMDEAPPKLLPQSAMAPSEQVSSPSPTQPQR